MNLLTIQLGHNATVGLVENGEITMLLSQEKSTTLRIRLPSRVKLYRPCLLNVNLLHRISMKLNVVQ